MTKNASIRFTRKDKNPYPVRLRIRVDGTRFSKRGGEKKKIRWDRSLPRGHWRLPSRSRIFTRSVFAREFFLSPSPYIDVNLAPIKAVAHVRGSCVAVASWTNLHRPYCCALKSQSKFHVDPLRDWPTALCVFATRRCGLIIAPERDRDPTRTSLPIAGSYYRFHAPPCHPNCMRSKPHE